MLIRLCTLALCLIATLDSALCQEVVWITGSILDQRSRPVSGAVVSLASRGLRDTTTFNGNFELKSTTAVRDGIPGSRVGVPWLVWSREAIRILLPSQSRVSLEIYTLQGRLVCRVLKKSLPAGVHVQPIPRGSLRDGPYVLTCQVNSVRKTALFTGSGVMHLYGAGNISERLTKQMAATDTLLVSSTDYISARVPLSALIADTNITLYRVAHIGLTFACLSNGGSCGFSCGSRIFTLYDNQTATPILSGYARDTIWFDHASGTGAKFTAVVYCGPADAPLVFVWQPGEIFHDTVLVSELVSHNTAPLITPQTDTVFSGATTMRITFHATDPDGDPVVLSAAKKFGSFENATGVYTWSPAMEDSSIDTIVVTATDMDLSSKDTVIVTHVPIHDKRPQIHKPADTSFVATQTMAFTITATDSDGTVPSMTSTKTKAGSSFTISGATGVYRWETTYIDSGLDTLTIFASDGVLQDSQVVHILCKPIYPRGTSGLRVGLPNGGEEYTVGETMTIMWYCDFAKCTTGVRIGVKISVQSPTVYIDSLIGRTSAYYKGNIGTYAWTVPQTVHNPVGAGYDMILGGSTDARVRIQAMGSTSQMDDSDNGFRVLVPVVTP